MKIKLKIPLGVYNTYVEIADDHPLLERAKAASVHPKLEPLFAMLSKARPTWEFVSDGPPNGYTGSTVYYNALKVYEDGELLGHIEMGYFRGETTHGATNKRISSARERSSFAYTKDTKKLASIILKNFYPKTIDEALGESAERTQNAIFQLTRNANNTYGASRHSIDPAMKTFMLDRWDEFISTLGNPVLVAAAERYKGSFDLMDGANLLTDVLASKRGAGELLMARGDKFLLREYKAGGKENEDRRVSLDDLSDATKGKLALLKLVEKGEAVADVGVRVTDDTYFIAHKEA